MTTKIDTTEVRAAHWRALNAPRRAARSDNPDSRALRRHRQVHHWNLCHEEEREKLEVPERIPGDNQMPLCMGDEDDE